MAQKGRSGRFIINLPPRCSNSLTHSSSATPSIVSCPLSFSTYIDSVAVRSLVTSSFVAFVFRTTHFTPRNCQPFIEAVHCSLRFQFTTSLKPFARCAFRSLQMVCFALLYVFFVFSLWTPPPPSSSSCTFFVQKLRTLLFLSKERKEKPEKEKKEIKDKSKGLTVYKHENPKSYLPRAIPQEVWPPVYACM